MSCIKTYGAPGLMEWQAQIKVGQATFTFLFSGGTLTGYGVTPALYSTNNKVYQAIIENSSYFKSGKIILVRSIENEDEQDGASTEETETVKDEDKNDGLKEIKVADFEAARQILINEYRVAPSKILTEAKLKSAAKGKGVKFVIG